MAYNMQSKDPHGLLGTNNSGFTPHPTDPPPYSGQPPPPYGTQPIQMTTIVPGAVIVQQIVGADPTHARCRACNMDMVTTIERKPTTRTHLMAGLLCLIGCWPCVCIPYCVDTCLNTDHYCTNCGAFVGTYIR